MKINSLKKILCIVNSTIVLFIASCDMSSTKNYLTAEQQKTIASVKPVNGTSNAACEINYTADYKLDDFINCITESKIVTAEGSRLMMKKLIADGSNLRPLERLTNSAPGCSSVICKSPEGYSLLGRNYDLDIRSNGAIVVIHTMPAGGYKSVGIADCGQCGLSFSKVTDSVKKELLLYAPYFTMDGVNEKGFACSIMLLNEGGCVQDNGKKYLPSTLVVRYLLDKADSVDNAVELLKNMDFKRQYFIDGVPDEYLSFHWALTDKTGNKAIIEYVNGNMIVNKFPVKVKYNETTDDFDSFEYPEKETGYLISTNFFVSKGFTNTKHDSGKWRYETIDNLMSKNSTPTKEQLRDVMKAVKYLQNDKDYLFELKQQGKDVEKPENWDWITLWTDILDTQNLTLSLWINEDYKTQNDFEIAYK